ncbi:MAG: SRPBCC domain-containing protein [Actinomycetota bacterium]|nr:SRPBCC domain-containing protein [Actinomycetota bacterium]
MTSAPRLSSVTLPPLPNARSTSPARAGDVAGAARRISRARIGARGIAGLKRPARWEVPPLEGGRVELRWLNSDEQGNRAVSHGTIRRLEPPRLLEYDSDIHDLLRWELHEDGDGCRLSLTNTTPAPDEYLTKVLAGWHIHLDHLADALAGHPVDWAAWTPDYRARGTGSSWAEHHERYAARRA